MNTRFLEARRRSEQIASIGYTVNTPHSSVPLPSLSARPSPLVDHDEHNKRMMDLYHALRKMPHSQRTAIVEWIYKHCSTPGFSLR